MSSIPLRLPFFIRLPLVALYISSPVRVLSWRMEHRIKLLLKHRLGRVGDKSGVRLCQLDLSLCLLYFHFHLAHVEVVYACCCLWILVLDRICWSRLLKFQVVVICPR